jgi:3-phosphoshikimate 1-carboxyvinyltransferase
MNLESSLFKVTPKKFDKEINVPGSKSYANRVLILAALEEEAITIENLPLSHDVERMINILKEIGLDIIKSNNSVTIRNSFPSCEKKSSTPIVLMPGDGGTTTRFIIPLLALGSNNYILEPAGRMRTRPISGLIDNLKNLDVVCLQTKEQWLSIQGPISKIPSSLEVDASKTTQHATALALVLKNTHIIPKGMDFSKSYWDMTIDLISKFKNRQTVFVTPVDFSSLSYPLALAATSGRVMVSNCLEIDLFQADSVLVNLLKEFGAKVELSNNGLEINRAESLVAINHDCSNCPDLVPTLGFICSLAKGISKLTNVKVLKFKESDRLLELFKIFNHFNIVHEYNEDSDELLIHGSDLRVSEKVDIETAEDHRMVMCSYLFLRVHSGGSVNHSGCVSKSFGNFFEVME